MLAARLEYLTTPAAGKGAGLGNLQAAARWAASVGRHVVCALHGHIMMLHCEPGRLSLRCLVCGAETPGWTLDVRPAMRGRAIAQRRPFQDADREADPRHAGLALEERFRRQQGRFSASSRCGTSSQRPKSRSRTALRPPIPGG